MKYYIDNIYDRSTVIIIGNFQFRIKLNIFKAFNIFFAKKSVIYPPPSFS